MKVNEVCDLLSEVEGRWSDVEEVRLYKIEESIREINTSSRRKSWELVGRKKES